MSLLLKEWVRDGLVLPCIRSLSGIDIKIDFNLVSDLDRSSTDGNRLNAELRLLQLRAPVIVVRPARNFKADFFASAMQLQRSGDAIAACFDFVHVRGLEMHLRIFLHIQDLRSQHGGLYFSARGIGSLGISYLHFFGEHY